MESKDGEKIANIMTILNLVKNMIQLNNAHLIIDSKGLNKILESIDKKELEESKIKGNIINNLNDYKNNQKYYENLKYDLICTIYDLSQIKNIRISFGLDSDSKFYIISLIEILAFIQEKKIKLIEEQKYKLSIFYLVNLIKDIKKRNESMMYSYCFYKHIFLQLLFLYPEYEDTIFIVSIFYMIYFIEKKRVE